MNANRLYEYIDVLKYCKILYMLNKLEINKIVLKIFSNFT